MTAGLQRIKTTSSDVKTPFCLTCDSDWQESSNVNVHSFAPQAPLTHCFQTPLRGLLHVSQRVGWFSLSLHSCLVPWGRRRTGLFQTFRRPFHIVVWNHGRLSFNLFDIVINTSGNRQFACWPPEALQNWILFCCGQTLLGLRCWHGVLVWRLNIPPVCVSTLNCRFSSKRSVQPHWPDKLLISNFMGDKWSLSRGWALLSTPFSVHGFLQHLN